jgi:hypothetical protein
VSEGVAPAASADASSLTLRVGEAILYPTLAGDLLASPANTRKAWRPVCEALGYIVQLYDATGNKSEADKWRRKPEELKKVATK